jgi:hypothetical protein
MVPGLFILHVFPIIQGLWKAHLLVGWGNKPAGRQVICLEEALGGCVLLNTVHTKACSSSTAAVPTELGHGNEAGPQMGKRTDLQSASWGSPCKFWGKRSGVDVRIKFLQTSLPHEFLFWNLRFRETSSTLLQCLSSS